MAANKRGLGRGLNALITSSGPEEQRTTEEINNHVIEIDINKIEPNKNQPRKYFNEESLNELAESIKEFGIIQPLVVNEENEFYSIVAGERRWRAARMAKLKTVPAIVRNYDEIDSLQIALIENIQRENLNPIEEALCYQKLIDIFFYRKEDIAAKIGKSRNTVGNVLSLLNLDPRVQNFVIEGKLPTGHARKLVEIKEGAMQFELADKIIDNELSLKETEKLIKTFLANMEESAVQNDNEKESVDTTQYISIENALKDILGTKVNIKTGKSKGKIEIEYYSEDELDRLIGIFKTIK